MKTTKKQIQILLASAAALLAAGCATPTTELPPQAVKGLNDLRSELVEDKAQIEKTTSAAKDMVNRPLQDVAGQIDAFQSALAKLSAEARQTSEAGTAANAVATDYFATWDQKLATISGQMAEAGQQRRQESMASWAKMQDSARALRLQFSPFMANLQQVSKYLNTDPTAAGVKAATPSIQSALDQEKDIMGKINDLISQIDTVRAGR